MRAQALLGLTAILVAVLLPGCPTCPSADRAPVVEASPGVPQTPRFVVTTAAGDLAELLLLDGELAPITFAVGGTTTRSWISTRSRWPNMRGTGIGNEPVIPRALSAGVPGLVTIGAATSIVALGLPTGQEDWEWVQPPAEDGTIIPIRDLLVVPDVFVVGAERHDLAFVARDRVESGTTPFGGSLTVGGDILVLDVESNIPTIVGTVPLTGVAEDGLDLTPRHLALVGGLIYVALEHGLVIGPDGSPIMRVGGGVVAVIDPVSRLVRNTLRFDGLTKCHQVVGLGSSACAADDPDMDNISSAEEDGGASADLDGDGTPNSRDSDSDGDGVLDVVEAANVDCGSTPRDLDGDSIPDYLDADAVPPGSGSPAGRVIVACAGTPDSPGQIPDDAGLVIIDRDPSSTEAPLVTRTLRATQLSIPSPDRGLTALGGAWVAFISGGSADGSVLEDRLYAVNVETEEVLVIGSALPNSTATPGGLGDGVYDPTPRGVERTTRLILPNGRAGIRQWNITPDAMTPGLFTFVEGEPVSVGTLMTCQRLPVLAVRLVP